MNYAFFTKPSRYIGNEINSTLKVGNIKVALCFPDTYEIGMSHLGLKILYSIINNIPYASAERFFSPWVDFESHIRKNDLYLTSLEFKRPLHTFDIIGFTLQCEISYTNILNMLDLGRLPIRSNDRDEDHPLVIAGGPCAVNPLPLAPFIDAFVIGDGEEIITEIVQATADCKCRKSGKRDKQSLLHSLSRLSGVYVPSVHAPGREKIKRRILDDLDNAPFPESPVVPFTKIVHDRVAIEISRGCSRGCRFCQAGMTYRPVRERAPERVLSCARKSIECSGYEEISFTSLSAGDYRHLLPLIKHFNARNKGFHTSVSLPSLRIGSINPDILAEIKSVRKTGFTIAPEAGSERLRSVINKDFSAKEYDETLSKLFSEGWSHIKLYFMLGLPSERQEDIDGLINMAVYALNKGKSITGRRVNVNVGISPFIPKPHTPFQWMGQEPLASLRQKQDYIKRAFLKRGINYRGQHAEHSLLEAVFSRGDIHVAGLLEAAWRSGCRFDGWAEHFDFSKWHKAADKTGMDLSHYAEKRYDINDKLPWDFIDIGITKEFMRSEYEKSLHGTYTDDCREVCLSCGLNCSEKARSIGAISHEKFNRHLNADDRGVPTKLRVIFSKTGMMRYLSHHELMTALFRAWRRAGIRVAYSSGYHPLPKISYGPALPVGVEGIREYFEVELGCFLTPEEFTKKINIQLPAGLHVREAFFVPDQDKSLSALFSRYDYEIEIDQSMKEKVYSFMDREEHIITRQHKPVDVRGMVKKAEISGSTLQLTLVDTEHAKVRLYEVLEEMLEKPADWTRSLLVRRTSLNGYNKGCV